MTLTRKTIRENVTGHEILNDEIIRRFDINPYSKEGGISILSTGTLHQMARPSKLVESMPVSNSLREKPLCSTRKGRCQGH
jgi:hypothetical protein